MGGGLYFVNLFIGSFQVMLYLDELWTKSFMPRCWYLKGRALPEKIILQVSVLKTLSCAITFFLISCYTTRRCWHCQLTKIIFQINNLDCVLLLACLLARLRNWFNFKLVQIEMAKRLKNRKSWPERWFK